MARRIAAHAEIGPGDRVVEIGAGLGSLTVPLAEAGADVLAIEFDRALLPALHEVVDELAGVRVMAADAMEMDWAAILGADRWTMVGNLPFNIATPLVMDLLESAPRIERFVIVVQREVGERWVAGPGEDAYGAASVRVAYRADAEILRRVPASVFWPRPSVESAVVGLVPHPPRVAVAREALFAVIEAGFAQRRKTMRSALRRLGQTTGGAERLLARCGLPADVRAEALSLEQLAAVAGALGG